MSKENLIEKLIIICDTIPKGQWKYFNKRTVENYINSVESINGSIDKDNTIIILSNYLNDVELNFEPDVHYCISLWTNHLNKIKPLYREIGFALVTGTRFLYAIVIAILIIAYLIKDYFYLEIFYLAVVATVFIRMLIKIKQNKAYGVCY